MCFLFIALKPPRKGYIKHATHVPPWVHPSFALVRSQAEPKKPAKASAAKAKASNDASPKYLGGAIGRECEMGAGTADECAKMGL